MRDFAEQDLKSLGITPVFYDPCDLAALEAHIAQGVRLVWAGPPGSLTMEMQDIPAITRLAMRAARWSCAALIRWPCG